MHQAVRAAMSKKNQTLTNAVQRYNVECTAILKMWPPDCQIPKPEPLPTSLTELKACTTLMESVWVSRVESDHRWVRDPDVREGICAMHKVARCREERRRLGQEADNMLRYFRRRLAAVTEALCDPSSAYFYFSPAFRSGELNKLHHHTDSEIVCLIRQEYEYMMTLPYTWKTDMVGEKKYRSAIELVNTSLPETSLTWITPIVCSDGPDEEKEEASNDECSDAAGRTAASTNDTAPMPLLDGQPAEEEPAPDLDPDQAVVQPIYSNVPPVCDSFASSRQCPTNTQKSPIHIDCSILDLLSPRVVNVTLPLPRRLRNAQDRTLFEFGQDEYARLSKIGARLNDECINGLAALIQTRLTASSNAGESAAASRCGILTTHAMLYVRCHLTELPLWRITRPTRYWEKDTWVVPIHRLAEEHWVMAVILPYQRRVYLFNSFASSRGWKRDIPVSPPTSKHQAALTVSHDLEHC